MVKIMIEHSDRVKKLQCTPKALEHIAKKLTQATHATALRIRLKKAGCSGWLYQFDYGSEPQSDEVVCAANGGLTVFIERERLPFFEGVIIDYVQSGFNGMLTCINPNEGIRCGCGESFTVEEQ